MAVSTNPKLAKLYNKSKPESVWQPFGYMEMYLVLSDKTILI